MAEKTQKNTRELERIASSSSSHNIIIIIIIIIIITIVSSCSNLAQKKYKKRHDKVALRVHWELNKKYDLGSGEKWYEHKPLPVIGNDQVKLVWDSTIVTDRRVPHMNRPDMF